MSKESISQQLFQHKNIKNNYKLAQSSSKSGNLGESVGFDLNLDQEKMQNDTKSHINIPDYGQLVADVFVANDQRAAALRDGSTVLQQAFSTRHNEESYDHVERVPKLPFDTEFVLPQVTSASLIQDGQDIVNYLKENRYHEDLEKRDQKFDVNSLVQEFEDALEKKDQERLATAITRLQQVWSHLSL